MPVHTSLSQRHGTAALVGKSVALMGDNRVSRTADLTYVLTEMLRISGGDDVTIDPKHREAFTTVLGTRFLLAGNEPLDLRDKSGAMDHRLFTLVMGPSFAGRENPHLDALISKERDGIAKWGVIGAQRLLARGYFIEPARSAQALVRLKRAAEPLAMFLEERCLLGRDFEVPKDTLYQYWVEWCRGIGLAPGTAAQFGRRLKDFLGDGLSDKRSNSSGRRIHCYVGVAVRATAPID